VECKFTFRANEIQLKVFDPAAAFDPCSGFSFVSDKPVETGAQEGLKARFGGVVVCEVILLESVREKSLRQILRVFIVDMPLKPDVFVNGLPVARENRLKRALPHVLIVATREHNRRLVRDGKAVLPTADICVWIDIHGLSHKNGQKAPKS
jgi:hypothetical protein